MNEAIERLSLAEVEERLWSTMASAVRDRRHAWHLVTLGTLHVVEDGTAMPELRTLVLRGVDVDARRLLVHTDARSPKVGQIAASPAVSVLMYDPASKQQARIVGRGAVHRDDALADRQWSSTRLMSRRCYLAPSAPSGASDEWTPNLPADLLDHDPGADRSEEGRENFAVVSIVVDRLEWLHLNHGGHERASFTYGGGGEVGRTWLTP